MILRYYQIKPKVVLKVVQGGYLTPRFAASDLDLRCLPMSHKKDTMLIWVNCDSDFRLHFTLKWQKNCIFRSDMSLETK